jgi:hypothetical protein
MPRPVPTLDSVRISTRLRLGRGRIVRSPQDLTQDTPKPWTYTDNDINIIPRPRAHYITNGFSTTLATTNTMNTKDNYIHMPNNAQGNT